jgi:serine/threonine protein phosphatase 1
MTYVMGDLHGMLDQFCDMLNKIKFKSSDTLYILGDIIDKGEESIKLLQNLSYRYNIFTIRGNHEKRALELLSALPLEAGSIDPSAFDKETLAKILEWSKDGGALTVQQYMALSPDEKEGVLEFLEDMPSYELAEVGGKAFILVHGGIAGFSPDKDLEDYDEDAFYTEGLDYSKQYYDNITIVSAHTPVGEIDPSNPEKIFKGNNHIAIECGVSNGGPLACYCLDNGKEYYVY